jgi:hypothetical protein
MNPAVRPWIAIGPASAGLQISRRYRIDYGIPVATAPHSWAAALRSVVVNEGDIARKVGFGLTARWGGLARVGYSAPIVIGRRLQSGTAPGTPRTHAFSFMEDEAVLPWAPVHRDCAHACRAADGCIVECRQEFAPEQRPVVNFIVSVGLEEPSAACQVKVLADRPLPIGAAAVHERASLAARLRTTAHRSLDELMTCNPLFSALFAWGRAYDTEQLVGATSHPPRYYGSAAYWDRDAMPRSVPALIDSDVRRARHTPSVALGMQRADAGTHRPCIDGGALESVYEFDENAAPIVALPECWRGTGATAYVRRHRAALAMLRANFTRPLGRASLDDTGQDAHDQNRRGASEMLAGMRSRVIRGVRGACSRGGQGPASTPAPRDAQAPPDANAAEVESRTCLAS